MFQCGVRQKIRQQDLSQLHYFPNTVQLISYVAALSHGHVEKMSVFELRVRQSAVQRTEGLRPGHSHGIMPCSTSCSLVLLCCRQSWRTVREQKHRGHRPKPNPLSHLTTICGFNHQTCQASDSTKCLLFPDWSATSKRPDGKPRHRRPIHFLHKYHKLYNSWTIILERHWPRAVPVTVDLSS